MRRAGVHQVWKEGCRESERRHQLGIPFPVLHREQTRGGCVRPLGDTGAGEEECQRVRHQQNRVGEVEASALLFGSELVQRVEREVLQAVAAIEEVEGHAGVDSGHPGLVALVPVVEGLPQQSIAAQQDVVDGPRVDSDAGDARLPAHCLGQPPECVGVEAGEVPVQSRGEPD